jgi:hypothetical protein
MNHQKQAPIYKFSCTLCPKRFTRRFSLDNHLRTHTNDRPFRCSHCEKAFTRRHDHQVHTRTVHLSEKVFVCRGQMRFGKAWGCGERFNRSSNFNRHLRSNGGRGCIQAVVNAAIYYASPLSYLVKNDIPTSVAVDIDAGEYTVGRMYVVLRAKS